MTPRHVLEPARLVGGSLLRAQTDARLVDMVRAGHDRAFEAIVARYHRPLLRHCRRLLPEARAEDAVQQAFINAYRAIVTGEAALDLRPWLHRIAHNACLSALRQNGFADAELPHETASAADAPHAVVERHQTLLAALAAVAALPDRQRDALVLRELEGRSYEEIAGQLGVSDGAVRQLLFRARETVRAGATALTPVELLHRLVPYGVSQEPIAERVAEVAAGAGLGAGALLTKAGATVLVTGAVAGGTVGLPASLGGDGKPVRLGEDSALAAPGGSAGAGDGDRAGSPGGRGGLAGGPEGAGRGAAGQPGPSRPAAAERQERARGGSPAERHEQSSAPAGRPEGAREHPPRREDSGGSGSSRSGEGSSGGDSRDGDGDSSGRGSGGSGGGSSGRGSGDDDDDDSSGHGSDGEDDGDDDSSGHGSGDDDESEDDETDEDEDDDDDRRDDDEDEDEDRSGSNSGSG